jgi:hypothetical protein
MPENVNKCPFSHSGCRNCPIYRGRHSYIMPKDGDETPQPRVLKKVEIDWQERFKEVLQNREGDTHAEETLRVKPQGTNRDGERKESENQSFSFTVLDKETGERRVCTVDEASTWDWGNRQKVRSIGPWHIFNFEKLLSILAHNVEAGCEEVELVEAPFYMGC